LIASAYRIPPGPLPLEKAIVGGSQWLSSDRFDLEATATNPASTTEQELLNMLQTLLAERFKLKLHHETRDVPGYELVVAKGKPKMEAANNSEPSSLARFGGGPLTGKNATIALLVRVLSGAVNAPVVDKTGLTGGYNFALTWTPASDQRGGLLSRVPPEVRAQMPIAAADPNGPSIFAAVQEQLGLKLESAKTPFEIVVIDHLEKLSD